MWHSIMIWSIHEYAFCGPRFRLTELIREPKVPINGIGERLGDILCNIRTHCSVSGWKEASIKREQEMTRWHPVKPHFPSPFNCSLTSHIQLRWGSETRGPGVSGVWLSTPIRTQPIWSVLNCNEVINSSCQFHYEQIHFLIIWPDNSLPWD